ncbi:MAG: hypothetical protein ACOYBS_11135 [Flavobacterium sp.]
MANATDFIASVYDTLATTFNMSAAPNNLFLQMAWPGFAISPEDCKDASGKYDVNLAEELFSSLANIVPVMDKSKYENSAYTIDDIYDIIISCARPNGVPDANLEANPLYKMFADAQYEFVLSQKGSSKDPMETYHKSIATPSNWYDETATSFWTSVNIQSNQVKPATSNPLFVKYNGLKLLDQGVIKLKSAPTASLLSTNLLRNINTEKNLVSKNFKTNTFTVSPNLLNTSSKMVFNKMKTATAARPTVALNTSFRNKLVTTNLRNTVVRPIPVTTFEKNSKVFSTINMQNINLGKLMVKPNIYTAKQALFLNNMLIKNLPTQSSVGTDGFSISFKYCRVNIDRPWLNLALLSTKNWSIYGTNSGEYSNGSSENNTGIFPLLPISFILISKVAITANWSATDKENLTNAVSFGPFDVRNGSFNQNTLEIKGMQIIGCLSKLTPMLAPTASPFV